MSNKQFKSALRRLRNGIPIYRQGETTSPHKHATFRVDVIDGKYRGLIIVDTDLGDQYVEMIWETPTLDWLRRIAVGYYPSIAKAIGPARQFAGI